MSISAGKLVSKHCAYARRSLGICALCLIPTFLSKPRISSGNIFMFSLTANCALAPAPAAVMLLLYAWSSSTSLFCRRSRASSSLCVSERSTALFARRVAMATCRAEAYPSEKFVGRRREREGHDADTALAW